MELIITNKKGVTFDITYDADDNELISHYRWYVNSGGYAVSSVNKINDKALFMHRLIMKIPEVSELQVDHINKMTLDNRKINLRVCTKSENSCNKDGLFRTSKYKGVSWYKNAKLWRSHICYNNERYMLGYFKNEIDAAIAYDNKAKELHKGYAVLNFE